MKPLVEKLLLAVGIVAATLTAVTPFFIIPMFVPIFSLLGTPLPLITQWVLNFYGIIVVLPFLVLLAWFFWPNRNRRSVAACAVGLGGSFLLTAIMMLGMYWPIFEMSSALQ